MPNQSTANLHGQVDGTIVPLKGAVGFYLLTETGTFPILATGEAGEKAKTLTKGTRVILLGVTPYEDTKGQKIRFRADTPAQIVVPLPAPSELNEGVVEAEDFFR